MNSRTLQQAFLLLVQDLKKSPDIDNKGSFENPIKIYKNNESYSVIFIDALIKKGKEKRRSGHLVEAVKYFQELIYSAYPLSFEAQVELGEIAQQEITDNKSIIQAMDFFKTALTLMLTDEHKALQPYIENQLFLLNLKKDNLNAAYQDEKNINHESKLNEDDFQNCLNLFGSEKYEEAKEGLLKIYSKNKFEIRIIFLLAVCYHFLNENNKSIYFYIEGMKLDNMSFKDIQSSGEETHMDHCEKLINHIKHNYGPAVTPCKLVPEDCKRLLNKVEQLNRKNKFTDAIEILTTIIRYHDTNVLNLINLLVSRGSAFRVRKQMGDYDLADLDYTFAVWLYNKHFDTQDEHLILVLQERRKLYLNLSVQETDAVNWKKWLVESCVDHLELAEISSLKMKDSLMLDREFALSLTHHANEFKDNDCFEKAMEFALVAKSIDNTIPEIFFLIGDLFLKLKKNDYMVNASHAFTAAQKLLQGQEGSKLYKSIMKKLEIINQINTPTNVSNKPPLKKNKKKKNTKNHTSIMTPKRDHALPSLSKKDAPDKKVTQQDEQKSSSIDQVPEIHPLIEADLDNISATTQNQPKQLSKSQKQKIAKEKAIQKKIKKKCKTKSNSVEKHSQLISTSSPLTIIPDKSIIKYSPDFAASLELTPGVLVVSPEIKPIESTQFSSSGWADRHLYEPFLYVERTPFEEQQQKEIEEAAGDCVDIVGSRAKNMVYKALFKKEAPQDPHSNPDLDFVTPASYEKLIPIGIVKTKRATLIRKNLDEKSHEAKVDQIDIELSASQTMIADANRRDFTIHTFYIDSSNGARAMHRLAIDDLRNNIIRHVSNPGEAINNCPHIIFRAIKEHVLTGRIIESSLHEAILTKRSLLWPDVSSLTSNECIDDQRLCYNPEILNAWLSNNLTKKYAVKIHEGFSKYYIWEKLGLAVSNTSWIYFELEKQRSSSIQLSLDDIYMICIVTHFKVQSAVSINKKNVNEFINTHPLLMSQFAKKAHMIEELCQKWELQYHKHKEYLLNNFQWIKYNSSLYCYVSEIPYTIIIPNVDNACEAKDNNQSHNEMSRLPSCNDLVDDLVDAVSAMQRNDLVDAAPIFQRNDLVDAVPTFQCNDLVDAVPVFQRNDLVDASPRFLHDNSVDAAVNAMPFHCNNCVDADSNDVTKNTAVHWATLFSQSTQFTRQERVNKFLIEKVYQR